VVLMLENSLCTSCTPSWPPIFPFATASAIARRRKERPKRRSAALTGRRSAMYESKARHPLSPPTPDPLSQPVYEAMWDLFLAIGELWLLTDDPHQYRLRFRTFLENRIALNPLYAAYYFAAATLIADLTAQANAFAAYQLIFFNRNPQNLEFDPELMQAVREHVAFELIARRMALGSFVNFGAVAYMGYMAGANLPDQPTPYRTAEGLNEG
jgi:hypothetical protein